MPKEKDYLEIIEMLKFTKKKSLKCVINEENHP